jgi:hypothetical protein
MEAEGLEAEGLGSCAHIRQTLARARTRVADSRELTAHSSTLLARAETLVDASAATMQASQALRAELRAGVTAYVRLLRADGVPPERMLVLVKSTIREATPLGLDAHEVRDLVEDVVRWSVEAYYHAA